MGSTCSFAPKLLILVQLAAISTVFFFGGGGEGIIKINIVSVISPISTVLGGYNTN
jgi:hypothetical protein